MDRKILCIISMANYLLVGGAGVSRVHAVQRVQGDDLAELGAELINGSPPPIDYATCTGW